MKTVKEAEKEVYQRDDDYYFSGDYVSHFREGFNFANEWIKTEDESPLAYETGEWDGKRSDFVLAKNKFGNIYIARTYEGIIDGSKFCDFAEKDDSIISHIVEWRPIERT